VRQTQHLAARVDEGVSVIVSVDHPVVAVWGGTAPEADEQLPPESAGVGPVGVPDGLHRLAAPDAAVVHVDVSVSPQCVVGADAFLAPLEDLGEGVDLVPLAQVPGDVELRLGLDAGTGSEPGDLRQAGGGKDRHHQQKALHHARHVEDGDSRMESQQCTASDGVSRLEGLGVIVWYVKSKMVIEV